MSNRQYIKNNVRHPAICNQKYFWTSVFMQQKTWGWDAEICQNAWIYAIKDIKSSQASSVSSFPADMSQYGFFQCLKRNREFDKSLTQDAIWKSITIPLTMKRYSSSQT